MIERPVRIGDLIEVDSHLGRVNEVGARCTKIRLVDGVELLVPNSKLLESNVINRTLTDRKFRASISVGVAYGSPTRKVLSIIERIVKENSRILQEPKPEVFFTEFGSSSLDFDAIFWVEVNTTTEIRRICSDVRLEIDNIFKENGIVIAFPQLDLHVDSAQPIDIRILNEEKK